MPPSGRVLPLSREPMPGLIRLSGYLAAVSAPQCVELLVVIFVDPAVGVGAEEVTQALRQGSRQSLGAQRVVVGQRRRESGNRDAQLGCGHHDPTPAVDG